VATGIPGGICTIENSASNPKSFTSFGTPITGLLVIDATNDPYKKQAGFSYARENGIPFFTSLYARIPVFLLIHHVHQEVFREHLIFPLSSIARFMEAKVMIFKINTEAMLFRLFAM